MAIEWHKLAIPKGPLRVEAKQRKRRNLKLEEKLCRAAVHLRDKHRCVVPGCKEKSAHLHHIVYRSKGGKWRSGNICSLCVAHHSLVHAGRITISGDANVHLTIKGSRADLAFRL